MEYKLNLYKDQEENEFIALIASPEFEKRRENDPELALIDSQPLQGDFTTWPTDVLFSQDMFK